LQFLWKNLTLQKVSYINASSLFVAETNNSTLPQENSGASSSLHMGTQAELQGKEIKEVSYIIVDVY
jgi:hypothetical protein